MIEHRRPTIVERVPGDATYTHQLRAFVAAVADGATVLTPPGDSVANMRVTDAVYDAAGLVTPDALRYTSVPARIDAVRPRYLLVNATRAEITMLRDGGFLHDYTAVRRFSPSGESTVVQDPQQYSAEWVQSYVWYARSGDADRVATRGLMRREP